MSEELAKSLKVMLQEENSYEFESQDTMDEEVNVKYKKLVRK